MRCSLTNTCLAGMTGLLVCLPAGFGWAQAPLDYYGEAGVGLVRGAEPEVDYIGIPIAIDPVDTEDGWSLYALAGLDFGRWRTELEIQHLRGEERTFEVRRAEINPGTARTRAQNRLTAVTANVAFDLIEAGRFVPFVVGGAGLGWSNDESAILDLSTVTPAATTDENDDVGVVALLGLGVSWQVTDTVSVVPSWRHVWSFIGADAEYDAFRVGLRFRF